MVLLVIQSVLGDQINHLYLPWQYLSWVVQWYPSYIDHFQMAGCFRVAVAALGLLLTMVTASVLSNSGYGDDRLHGSARFRSTATIIIGI